MAEALIKYETIDSHQIDDIMAGKTPRPPQDWDDSEPTASSGTPSADSEDSDDKAGGSIGGPAGQH